MVNPLILNSKDFLGLESLKQVVILPGICAIINNMKEGENEDEWIAAHCVDFNNHLNMLYSAVSEFCTKSSCPAMMAGYRYEYHWIDHIIKKPIKLSAPEYMERLMAWINSLIDDESIFPTKEGVAFPETFRSNAENIFKRLFRVYAHIYHHHFPQIVALGQESHFETSFIHFILFSKEFGLIQKREFAPLEDLIKALLKK